MASSIEEPLKGLPRTVEKEPPEDEFLTGIQEDFSGTAHDYKNCWRTSIVCV